MTLFKAHLSVAYTVATHIKIQINDKGSLASYVAFILKVYYETNIKAQQMVRYTHECTGTQHEVHYLEFAKSVLLVEIRRHSIADKQFTLKKFDDFAIKRKQLMILISTCRAVA